MDEKWRPRELTCSVVRKVTYFGGFGHLNSFLVPREINSRFYSKMTDVSAGFQEPPCWCPSLGAHPNDHQHGVSLQISSNLGKNFLHISYFKKIAVTSVLARVFAYLPGSYPRFWTLPVKRIFVLIYSGTPPYEHPVNATSSLITATLFWPEKSLVRHWFLI